MFSAQDAGGLINDLVRMVKAHEIEEATNRIQQAQLRHAQASYDNRAEAVAAISKTIFALKRGREELKRGISALPEDVKLHAEHTLTRVVWRYFDEEIARLKTEKRRLSR